MKKNEILSLYKQYKNKPKDIVSKNIVMTDTERNIIEEFVQENQVSYQKLMHHLLFKDGVLNNDIIEIRKKIYPRSDYSFTKHIDFTYGYKEQYKSYYFDLSTDQKKPKNFHLKYVENLILEKHYKSKKYTSFAQYARDLLNNAGIYPDGFYEEVKKYVRDDYGREKNQQKQRRYERDQQLQEGRKRKRRKLKDDDEFQSHTHLVLLTKTEKEIFIDPFVASLQQKNLNLQKFVKYKLVQAGVIDIKEAKLSMGNIRDLKEFYYNENKVQCNKESIAAKVKEDKKTRKFTNIGLVLPNNPYIKETFGKLLSIWFRHTLNENNVYSNC
ncbi:hypothetical protein, partial [Sulfurimonas sp.]